MSSEGPPCGLAPNELSKSPRPSHSSRVALPILACLVNGFDVVPSALSFALSGKWPACGRVPSGWPGAHPFFAPPTLLSVGPTATRASRGTRMPRSSARSGGLSIGDLARRAGCKVQTVRYYEQIGLMPPPQRTTGNQRSYERIHADRLAFIRHSRELGFPLDAIRELLALTDDPNRSCDQADRIARAHLREVETRIGSLTALKTELKRMLQQCRSGRIAECRVIDVLTDHGKCATDDHHLWPTASASLGN